MKKILRKYSQVRTDIWEADILLFRGSGFFSKLIKIASKGEYSHVGLASWQWAKNQRGVFIPKNLELIEFREFKGGRVVNLSTQIDAYPGLIDVYRPARKMQRFSVEHPSGEWTCLNPIEVTNTMRLMTGLPYGWKRIWLLARESLLGTRIVFAPNIDDEYVAKTYPVCSGAVCRSFRKSAFDLVKNKSDDECDPSDISRSVALSYLFTLIP